MTPPWTIACVLLLTAACRSTPARVPAAEAQPVFAPLSGVDDGCGEEDPDRAALLGAEFNLRAAAAALAAAGLTVAELERVPVPAPGLGETLEPGALVEVEGRRAVVLEPRVVRRAEASGRAPAQGNGVWVARDASGALHLVKEDRHQRCWRSLKSRRCPPPGKGTYEGPTGPPPLQAPEPAVVAGFIVPRALGEGRTLPVERAEIQAAFDPERCPPVP